MKNATLEQVRAAVPWLKWDSGDIWYRFQGSHPDSPPHSDDAPLIVWVHADLSFVSFGGYLGSAVTARVDGDTLEERLIALPELVREMAQEMVEEADAMSAAAVAIGGGR